VHRRQEHDPLERVPVQFLADRLVLTVVGGAERDRRARHVHRGELGRAREQPGEVGVRTSPAVVTLHRLHKFVRLIMEEAQEEMVAKGKLVS